MSIFLLSSTLEDDLHKMNSFWWDNNNQQKRGIDWLNWDKMTMKKNWRNGIQTLTCL